MIYLLDTSALLILTHKEGGLDRVTALFEDPENEMLLCVVSAVEFGRKLREKNIEIDEVVQAVEKYCSLFASVVPVDSEIAETSLRLLNKIPGRLPLGDSLIAAAAMSRGACLVHKDKHLASIPGSLLSQINLLPAPAG